MELRRPCELMCGIVLNSFPLHFDTVDMQRCMVAIELNARKLLDERRATRDDPLAHQRETSTCHSHRKKRPTGVGPKTEWKAPETTHAVQHLVFSQDAARVPCSRCTRAASKSHSGHWQAFLDQNLRQVERSRIYWSGAAMRGLVELLAEEHEVAVEDLLFSGDVQAPINCRVCRKAWLFMGAGRNHNTKKLRLESCPRTLMAANRVRERLQHFAAQPSSHSWQISPAEYLLICNQCGLYIVDVPHRTTAERSYPFNLKSVDRVSLGCGKAFTITMTKMCGCLSHPLKVGLHFLQPCIRCVSLFEQVLSILMTTKAVFTGCVSFFLS